MAGVQRTPPNTPKVRTPLNNLSQTQTQSEPDINSAIMMSDYVNTNRNKRRKENSPQGGLDLGPQDLEEKLVIWKNEQDSNISKMLTEQTASMAKLIADIGEIKTQNALIHQSNTEIRKSNEDIAQSMYFMNKKFEEMRKEVEDLRKERQEQQKCIETLEQKINDLQHKSRSSGIELRNIPEGNSETNASLIKTVCKIGELVGVHVPETNLRDIYRLPVKSTNSTTPRPIIAEFTTVQTKQALITAVRSYNKEKGKGDKINSVLLGIPGNPQPVYIAEQLPASTKKLFYLTRQYANNNNYKFCWVSNGNISFSAS